MRRRSMLGVAVLAVATVLVMGGPGASGATSVRWNIDAASLVGREYSVHNRNGGLSNFCSAFAALTNPGENFGDMDNGKGSFFAALLLPHGATVTTVRLFVNDNDGDDDVAVYLLRKQIGQNLAPATTGYTTMGFAKSNGAANMMRRFGDTTIANPVVNTESYMYFVELVDCGVPEPYAVQVMYTTP